MWDEGQRRDLAQVTERDKQAAAVTARRLMDRRYAGMLDAPPDDDDDSEWLFLALLGLGAFAFRGRTVRQAAVRRQLDRVLRGLGQDVRSLSSDPSSADRWALSMIDMVKAAALVGSAFAIGGWARLNAREVAFIESHVGQEVDYLNRFADEVDAGRVAQDGRFVRRAMLYASAGWSFYQLNRNQIAGQRGYVEERNILDPGAEHCDSCVGQSSRGWVPIGTLIPIGQRLCLSNCRCYLEYRNAAGEVVT